MFILYSLLTAILTVFLLAILVFIVFVTLSSKLKKKKNSYTNTTSKKATTIIFKAKNIKFDSEDNPLEENENFSEIVKKIKDVSNNEKIKKIIIDTDNFELSPTQVDELRPIFNELNKKKEVISISSILDNNNYLIASLANKVYLQTTVNSTLIIQGYYKKLNYMKSLLNKIGVNIKVLHIGEYKSYGENYSKYKMSDSLKENSTLLLDEKLNNFISKIKEIRGVDITNDLIEGKLFFSDNEKLIDGRLHKDLMLQKEEKIIELSDYEYKNKKNKSKNEIAVIGLEGTIKEGELSYDSLKEKIEQLDDIKNLKGIILEINSPGGSAYEASLMYQALKNIKVPIYASMKDVCASGGYFIACSGKKMFANRSTITGSIGVVSLYPQVNGLYKKLGINVDGVYKGETTEFGHLTSYLSIQTEEKIINHMKDVYKEFKSAVIDARKINDDVLEPLAGGRVWSAKQAKENNLIDGILTFDEIIEFVKKDLKIDNCKIIYIKKKFNLKKHFKNRIPLLNYEDLLYKPLFFTINY